MVIDIQKIVDIREFKNGKKHFHFPFTIRQNIYEFLYKSGFRSFRLKNKNRYLKLNSGELELTDFTSISNYFTRTLSELKYENCPDNVEFMDILNSVYDKMPIKKRELTRFLKYEPNPEEKHKLLMKIDPFYAHDFKISEQKKMFKDWSFKKAKDKINSYSSNNPTLFYRAIGDNNFMIANYYNEDLRQEHLDGFDFWIAEYENENDIGEKESLNLKPIYYSGSGKHPIKKYFRRKVK